MKETSVPPDLEQRTVPPRALALSCAALLVPVVGALAFPEVLGDHGALLWLSALVPAFLLAYYRGWRGIATALALGMATLSLTQVAANLLGRTIPDTLLGVVVAYLAISLGVGWIADSLHRERATVEDLAFTDLLTRLPNRRHARIFLDNEFAAGERGRLLSVVLFDLDHFKEYNDRYGHPMGDEALKAFAEILARTTRKSNVSARFGGEEFLSVLAGSDAAGAKIFAERVRAALHAAELPAGRLTVSAGVAAQHPSMRSPDELLAAADHALYRAKKEGRNCVRVFGREMLGGDSPGEAETPPAGGEAESPPAPAVVSPGDSGRPPAGSGTQGGEGRPPVTLLPHQITGFGQGAHLLLVEDEKGVRGLLGSYLAQEGFRIREAGSVEEALLALDTDFDVIVTDVRLPGPSGLRLISASRARWPRTPVLAISGLKDPDTMAQALQAGADAFLHKPFGMPELRATLADLLARRKRLGGGPPRGEGGWSLSEAAREKLLDSMRGLLDLGESREPGARGRSTRLRAVGSELALGFVDGGPDTGLDPVVVGLSSMLTPLGRIRIDAEILNRREGLEVEELMEVCRAPRYGAEILANLGFPDPVVRGVRWSGERWDGTGTATVLQGPSIPLEARIAALARGLEAMTRDRPHAPRLPWEEALREVRGDLGRAYDPALGPALDRAEARLRHILSG